MTFLCLLAILECLLPRFWLDVSPLVWVFTFFPLTQILILSTGQVIHWLAQWNSRTELVGCSRISCCRARQCEEVLTFHRRELLMLIESVGGPFSGGIGGQVGIFVDAYAAQV